MFLVCANTDTRQKTDESYHIFEESVLIPRLDFQGFQPLGSLYLPRSVSGFKFNLLFLIFQLLHLPDSGILGHLHDSFWKGIANRPKLF